MAPQPDVPGRKWIVTSAGFAFIVILSLLLAGRTHPVSAATSEPFHVMAWGGSTPEADKLFHFSGVRQGCSSPPESCMRAISSVSHDPNLRIFLSILLKPETAVYGAEYSQLSRNNPSLEEIGLDDFVSQYSKLYQTDGQNARGALDTLITGVKLANPNLRFGITLYEDDLVRAQEYLSDPKLPASIRNRIDYVHFYIHFRADSPKYAEYLNRAKAIFPNAQMIAGVYAYDRISYLPCALKSSPCTAQEEMNYFNMQLDTAISLLKSGAASWIELFPGYFGREDQWPDWTAPRICPPERRQACIETTKQMHEVVLTKLRQLFG